MCPTTKEPLAGTAQPQAQGGLFRRIQRWVDKRVDDKLAPPTANLAVHSIPAPSAYPPPPRGSTPPPPYEAVVDKRRELETQIFDLFRKVWTGLYGSPLKKRALKPREQVKALYQAAAPHSVSSSDGKSLIEVLFNALSRDFREDTDLGAAQLKLYPTSSIESLQEVVNILHAYAIELQRFETLQAQLRRIDMRPRSTVPTSPSRGTPWPETNLAVAIAHRLEDIDNRVGVLAMDMAAEAVQMHLIDASQPQPPEGRFVFRMAFSG